MNETGPLFVLETFGKPMLIVGANVSITMALLAPSEPANPGAGSVKTVLLRAASLSVPPFKPNEFVAE